MSELNLDLKPVPTYHVNFLTYAWMVEKNTVGLDKFIADCYGLDGDMEMGSGNDTDYSVNVESEKSKYEWDTKTLDKIKRSKWMEDHHLRLVLCDLCADGHIPEGKYVVTMSW